MSTYKFSDRHIGPRANDITEMLKVVNASSLNQLIDETIPEKIHLGREMNLSPCFTYGPNLPLFT